MLSGAAEPTRLSKLQADLHSLAAKHLLNSECRQFEYEGFKEAVPIKITISRATFINDKSDLILMIIKPNIPLPDAEASKIHLTSREYAVLQLLIQGNSCKKIAQILSLSHHTITDYFKAIYSKLGARSSTQAVLIATTRLGMRPMQSPQFVVKAHARASSP